MEEEQYDTSNGFGWPVSLKTYKLGDNILSFVLSLLICFQILAITSGIHTRICLKLMKLKFIWPVILTSKYISIIFSPV